ncbi:DinB family protein [Paenibacillus taihuensis]|uniref:DinB family protein n=1 Tax=Paenibacillus taihuensis TaxID=1156355 RepID=A0A3D9R2N6_9BACL|nr:DinB family protein [Paenibacillus taihuensis]REE68754.1 DinB family protein [Paenibacillus taihuensis]
MVHNASAIIKQYIQYLDSYSIEQLRYKSDENVWSIGQMYIHVIEAAKEYLEYAAICAKATDEATGGKTEDGMKTFAENEWPNIRVKLDEPPNSTRNPESKAEVQAGLDELLAKLEQCEGFIDEANPACKLRHGWFGWLNAREWVEMVNMHSRHHLRQKELLDEKLAEAGLG